MSNIKSRTEPGTHDKFKMRPLSIRLLLKIHIRSEFFSKLLASYCLRPTLPKLKRSSNSDVLCCDARVSSWHFSDIPTRR